MGYVIHNPDKRIDAFLRRQIKLYCEPHGINPKGVTTITVHDVGEEPRYLIEYYNKDGHFCTIEVYGELTEEMQPKQKGKKIETLEGSVMKSMRIHSLILKNAKYGLKFYEIIDCNEDKTTLILCSPRKRKCEAKKC